MYVPPELESAVKRGDEDEHQPEVHMRREPARGRAALAERAPPDAIPREINDQQSPDRAQRVSQPGSAARLLPQRAEDIGEYREQAQRSGAHGISILPVIEK